MPVYSYTFRDASGGVQKGTAEAESEDFLRKRFEEQGFTITEVQMIRARAPKQKSFGKVKLMNLSIFCRQFSTMVDAGVSLVRCLDVLSQQTQDPKLKKIAIWTYYKSAKRDPGLDEGATTVAYVPQKGWFWFIPLPDNMTSVGIVAEKDYLFDEGRDFEKIFEREIKKNVWITEHLDGAERVADFQATGEFSYRSKHCAADGIVLAGDAFAFLDPVFSSGLFLALLSGEKVADAVHRALDRGDYSASQFEEYGSNLCSGIEAMRKLVYAFYDENFSFRELIMKHPDVRPDLTDCLIGNLMRDFDALFKGVADFANVPQELSHGKPLVAVAV